MKTKIALALMIALCGCSSVKVLDSTPSTAIIQAEGKSETEAKIEAIKKGRELLGGEVVETKAAECKPLIRYGGYEISDVKLNQNESQIAPFTDVRCIVFLKQS